MAELKTQQNEGDVDAFLASVDNATRREDAIAVRKMMAEVTGEPGSMWGDAIVGFGHYSYRYATGREGEWFKVGFSPRKQNLTLYLMTGFEDHTDTLDRLGKHSLGKSCLYIKRLADIDPDVLRELVTESFERPAAGE